MSLDRLLRFGRGGRRERRKSPRIHCRLQCTLRKGRRSVRARVLDVSEGGLCLLSPVSLQARQPVTIVIDVPRRGPVEVEAVAWHVRAVKSGREHRQAWSIGMMITKAGTGFASLLPEGTSLDAGADEELAEKLGALTWSRERRARLRDLAPPGPAATGAIGLPGASDDALEEDALDEAELRELEGDFLTPDPVELLCAKPDASPDHTLRLFRVRVKAKSGPRTRALTLGAVSLDEAYALACSELDDAWQVLEVSPL